MRKFKILAILACLVVVNLSCNLSRNIGTTPTGGISTAERLAQLGGYPCPDSSFTCVKLTVPLDYNNAKNGPSTQVVFAIQPASGQRKGMFVTVVGGPGGSGLQVADSYTAAFDPSIPEHFDIVFFDQRGVGASGGLDCPQAAGKYYLTDINLDTPAGEAEMLSSAQVFSEACAAEMGNPAILPYLGTAQAIQDLEAFRQTIGDDKFWLYGESYGTQFSQAYAAAYPQHLAALILDGTVDLTLSGTDFLAEQATAFDKTLSMTLSACNTDPACAGEFGKDAAVVYNDLAAKLKLAPLPFSFPLPSGGTAQRMFNFGDLESSASGYMYSEGGRLIFLRALASYARDGDLAPMASILYDTLSIDPETLVGVSDPSFSNAIYYGVECQDYTYFSGTTTERAAAYLRAGDPLKASLAHFSSIFYGDFPCVFWPDTTPPPTRPTYLTLKGVPTLVLGATADPATPLSNGQSVFQHLADGYLVVEQGGPHVIFGWGNECVDSLVTNFLVNNTMPKRETACAGVVSNAFVPLAPRSAADFQDPLAALDSAYNEIYYLPEYYYWDVKSSVSVGCPYSGTLAFDPTGDGNAFSLNNCAFSEGFAMTGTGSYKYHGDGSFNLDVALSGLANGTMKYTHSDTGAAQVTGTYNGQSIDLTEAGK